MSLPLILSYKKKEREALTSLWSKKLYYKFVESTEDGDFVLALDAVRLVKETFLYFINHTQTLLNCG